MSEEDRELMAQISQLAGQINRHKAQQAGHHAVPSNSRHTSTGWPRGAPYARRGYRGGHGAVHRHRSLVLNGTQPSGNDPSSRSGSDASGASFVAKNDRHLQLINSNIYEKDAQARAKAMEQTARQKQIAKDQREQAKLLNHLRRTATATNRQASTTKYEINVQGIPFRVTKNGSKLVRTSGEGQEQILQCFGDAYHQAEGENSALATPKTAVIGGVRFYRSKNGNLYRHGIVKAQRHSGAVKKVNVPCKNFSTTGSCANGPGCQYRHDPSKVAVCKDLLLRGQCVNGDACDLSHELTAERTPHCLHFAKDACSNSNCRYTHVKTLPGALVCRPFGIYGYCDKGSACLERHVLFECPDFSNTGVCKTKGCKLPHRERASVLRKREADAKATNAGDDAEMTVDLSSDEDEESLDSNDVDSDEVEEFIGQEDGDEDLAFADQKDFIQL